MNDIISFSVTLLSPKTMCMTPLLCAINFLNISNYALRFFSWSLKNSRLLMLWFVTCRGWWHLEIIRVCLDPLSARLSVRLLNFLFHLLLNIVLMQVKRVHAALDSNINKTKSTHWCQNPCLLRNRGGIYIELLHNF